MSLSRGWTSHLTIYSVMSGAVDARAGASDNFTIRTRCHYSPPSPRVERSRAFRLDSDRPARCSPLWAVSTLYHCQSNIDRPGLPHLARVLPDLSFLPQPDGVGRVAVSESSDFTLSSFVPLSPWGLASACHMSYANKETNGRRGSNDLPCQ